MTREEIIKELTKDVHMPTCCSEEGCMAIDQIEADMDVTCSNCEVNNIVKAFCKGIDYQKEQSPWISVKDDLPCNHKELIHSNYTDRVLVMSRFGYTEVAFMYKMTEDAWEWSNLIVVLYWMPIPELPKL